MSLRNRTWLLLGAPVITITAVVVTILLEGMTLNRMLMTLVVVTGVVLFLSVGLALHLRYPNRKLGVLLFALAGLYASQGLVLSADPFLFTMGRVMRPGIEVVLIWIMLAFPSGKLHSIHSRALLVAFATGILLLWLPAVMLSPQIPFSGTFVLCLPDCPRNVLAIGNNPELVQQLLIAYRITGVLFLVMVATLLSIRLKRATPLMRRMLAPVLLASVARILAVASALVVGGFLPALLLTVWAIPLAIAFGLYRARTYMTTALLRLVTGLRTRPDSHTLCNVVAKALDDPSLSIAYWLPERQAWVDGSGLEFQLPKTTEQDSRAITQVRDSNGHPVAALIHDAALLEEPMLLDAVADSTLVVLESQRLAVEQATTAIVDERQRIERDLHDGAQQRLIALRLKLSVTARVLDHDPHRAAKLVHELGKDVEDAIAELRAFARGVVPPLLVELGLAAALVETAERAPILVELDIDARDRYPPAIESAIYFCCLEALQNAAKHAGEHAVAQVKLHKDGHTLRFCVTNTASKTTEQTGSGQGLSNMRSRIGAVGGQIDFETRHSQFRVSASIPLTH